MGKIYFDHENDVVYDRRVDSHRVTINRDCDGKKRIRGRWWIIGGNVISERRRDRWRDD